jgi:hypothetical protein
VCVSVRVGGFECMDAGRRLAACSLNNSAYNAPPLCRFRPLWLHQICRYYHTNGTIFGEARGREVSEIKMCVFILYTNFIWNLSHSKKNSTRYCHKCENDISSTRYFCRILVKTEFSQQVFWQKLKYKISSVSGGQTDGHDEDNSRFSQFYEQA